ncbi:hypothetical protein BH09ACT4_BH09ACT4_12630 [soil metagenome]
MHNNPFRLTLLLIAILGAVLAGAIALYAAASSQINGPFIDPSDDSVVNNAPAFGFAFALLSIAITSMMLWLHASSISWAAENPSPPKEDSDD